jgi:succinoglycan biosynthesis protein ExoM
MSARPTLDIGVFDVTVSIATYDRVDLLERTIASVQAQQTKLSFEILITDNHATANARPLVERMAETSPVPLRYQEEPARNMSVLRNAGIKAARGAFVAFIDDDETADPAWLEELMGAVRRTGADIAVGYRAAIFGAKGPPAYDPSGKSFERTINLPPDSLVPLVRADGKHEFGLGTGNSMFNAATCFRDAEPFSVAIFGKAGGEDSEFFVRQYKEGRTIVWAAKAKVTELVAEHRTTAAYRLLRTRRETQAYVTTYVHHAPNRAQAWLKLMVKGVMQTVAGAVITVATWEFGSERRMTGRLLLTHGLAKLQWKNPVGYIDETKFAE